MATPEDVRWNKDLVYNAMWNLLVEMTKWNKDADAGSVRIRNVLLTGLGTGVGEVDAEVCAKQMMLAAKHFVVGVPKDADWDAIRGMAREVMSSRG